jgi:hypothetical protein
MTVLFLTATITPPRDAPLLKRTDVRLRIDDYKTAFAHYCNEIGQAGYDRIVFVENSGYGVEFLSPIAKAANASDRVEVLSYKGLLAGATRFYGECSLLKYGFETSRFIRESGPGAIVWKVAGRYIVPNLAAIIKGASGAADFYCHCRNWPMRYVDFCAAGFRTRSALEILDVILSEPDVRGKDEAVLRDLIDEGKLARFRIEPRFARIPDFVGVRGRDNADYQSPAHRMKYFLRVAASRVAPRLWL